MAKTNKAAPKAGTGGTRSTRKAESPSLGEQERTFLVSLNKDAVLSMKISILSAGVGGKGPRPKKDELLAMLSAALIALLDGRSAKPTKSGSFASSAMASGVGGPGRKRRLVNP